MNADLYNTLAALLTYPGASNVDADENVGACPEKLTSVILSEDAPNNQAAPMLGGRVGASESKDPYASPEIALFLEQTRTLSTHALQELYIRTFDLNPVCSLEMGWHLFGENYDRGLLLVKMRQELRQFGIEEATELPDHLTYALRLIPRMDHDSASYFVEAVVLPALEKMLDAIAHPKEGKGSAKNNRVAQGFSPANIHTKETKASAPVVTNPYAHVLLAVQKLLRADFPEAAAAQMPAPALRVLV